MKNQYVVNENERQDGEPLFSISSAFKKQGGDPRQRHSGRTPLFDTPSPAAKAASSPSRERASFPLRGKVGEAQIRGFTLIELLVVVLIIGILAAVALPQYQKAVYKNRLMSIIPNVKALHEARESYFLDHGDYGPNGNLSMDALDIHLPDTPSSVYKANVDNWYCSGHFPRLGGAGNVIIKNKVTNMYGICSEYNPYHTTSSYTKGGKAYCAANIDDSLANQICLDMGGTLWTTQRIGCAEGTKYQTQCNAYSLP